MINPKSGIIAHITLSILCIDAFSQSFCFYCRLFVRFFFDIAHYACEKSNENPLVKSLWIYGSGHHYPCLNAAFLLKMYNLLKTNGLCLYYAYCRQCVG